MPAAKVRASAAPPVEVAVVVVGIWGPVEMGAAGAVLEVLRAPTPQWPIPRQPIPVPVAIIRPAAAQRRPTEVAAEGELAARPPRTERTAQTRNLEAAAVQEEQEALIAPVRPVQGLSMAVTEEPEVRPLGMVPQGLR